MWLPPESIYLDRSDAPHIRPHRPLHQGDIFTSAPIAIARPNPPSLEETYSTQLATVALLGHPCSIRRGPALLSVVSVAMVQRKADLLTAGAPAFEEPWDSYYHLFPLRDFLGDEDDVVNFRKIGTTPSRSLDGQRIACLSHAGWVAFQRRFANYSVRIDPGQQELLDETRGEWEEIELWEEWIRRGNDPDRFEEWIRAPHASGSAYDGTERKQLLAFAPELVRETLP